MKEERTSINITKSQRERIAKLGEYGEKMSEIFERVLKFYEDKHTKNK